MNEFEEGHPEIPVAKHEDRLFVAVDDDGHRRFWVDAPQEPSMELTARCGRKVRVGAGSIRRLLAEVFSAPR